MGVSGLQVMLRGDGGAVAQPFGDRMGGMYIGPIGRAGRPHVVEEAAPGLLARLEDDPLELGSQVHARST